jgi:hypothetical protein
MAGTIKYAPIHLSLEEVAVNAGHKVLMMAFDFYLAVIHKGFQISSSFLTKIHLLNIILLISFIFIFD